MSKPLIAITAISENDKERFYNYVPTIPTERGCREWMGSKRPQGYGRLKVGGKDVPAHRLAYFLEYGECPLTLFVCHRCDNPICVEPTHLFLGTSLDNNRDMIAKGRAYYPSGDDHHAKRNPGRMQKGEARWNSKLKETDILAIRADKRILREIAADYGVGQPTIHKIKHGKAWSQIPVSAHETAIRTRRGEDNGHAKLSEQKVIEIRARYAAGGVLIRALALEFGVTETSVSGAIHRKTWKHVP